MSFSGKKHSHLYFLQFRVVKIKTAENTYEYLITNLPFSFTLDDIRECYHWRWGIEISFRYLKHATGLLYFHSKQPEFLKTGNLFPPDSVQFRHFYRKRSGRRKPEKETGW